jgi:Flagellar motor protein
MARKRKASHHAEEEGGEAWLLPYSDLMTLLLAVFIVLFAVSKMDQTKAKAVAEAFSQNMMMSGGAGALNNKGDSIIDLYPSSPATSTQPTGNTVSNNEDATQKDVSEFLGEAEYDKMGKLKAKLDQVLKDEGMSSSVSTSIDMRGLVISFNNAILFDSGSAEIKKEHIESLRAVARAVKALDNYLRVEGHTDNIPVHSAPYPSNWELSYARAVSVVQLFINECQVSPEKLVPVGYGETRPIASNDTEEGRAKNRRIDIIVLSSKYNNLEKQMGQ